MIARIALLLAAANSVVNASAQSASTEPVLSLSKSSGQAASTSSGQAYPAKSIRIIAPFSAGGPVDITACILAQKLNESWGQSVIVENRAGARAE